MADKDHFDWTPKQWAYARAYELLDKARVKPDLCTPATAKAATAELKKLAKRINRSFIQMGGNKYFKKMCDDDPKFAELVKKEKRLAAYCRADITRRRIEDEWKKEREAEKNERQGN